MKNYKQHTQLTKDSVEWWAKALSEEKAERLQKDYDTCLSLIERLKQYIEGLKQKWIRKRDVLILTIIFMYQKLDTLTPSPGTRKCFTSLICNFRNNHCIVAITLPEK